MQVGERGLLITDKNGSSAEFPFSSFTLLERTSWLLFWAKLRLTVGSGVIYEVPGLGRAAASSFIKATEKAQRDYLKNELAQRRERLLTTADRLRLAKGGGFYMAASTASSLLNTAKKVSKGLPRPLPDGVAKLDDMAALAIIYRFTSEPNAFRTTANESFILQAIPRMKPFFDTIEKVPLTREQSEAVVTDEDATRVLAAAGSGKTSVIVAKAAYLVKERLRKPNEILMLAYGKAAAKEMSGRVKRRSGHVITAWTFHRLGNTIIREVEGRGPPLATYAEDEKLLFTLLKEIAINLVVSDTTFAHTMKIWFAEFFAPYKSLFDFKIYSEYLDYVRTTEMRTLQGELVKSFEECEIANFLFLNGVAYEYEPDYEHDTSSTLRRSYTPDFWLPEYGIYIEHFGVRKVRDRDGKVRAGPNGKELLEPPPYFDRTRYLNDMLEKIDLHLSMGTVLVTTFSYEKSEGHLTSNLRAKLLDYGVIFNSIPTDQIFVKLLEFKQVDTFTNLVGEFLHHYKANAFTLAECEKKAGIGPERDRNISFLRLFSPIFQAYQAKLKTDRRIDFEDMIARATKYAESRTYVNPFKHILVDEFQDISVGRAKLLKALLKQHWDGRLFAVGDDWQAIYRFAGSDLAIMRSFGAEFGGTFSGETSIEKTVDLGRTFRCVDRVAAPAKHFVTRNPAQLPKRVIPASTANGPAVQVFYTNEPKQAVEQILSRLNAEAVGKTEVKLLARYNFLLPKAEGEINERKALERNFPLLKLGYQSVHSSKGLEADHIIVLGMDSGRWGFPSEIVDDPVLNMVLPIVENFPHAEERRLFYVALTRAKKTVHLIAKTSRPSAFANELAKEPVYGVQVAGDVPGPVGGCARCGGRMLLRQGDRGPYYACEHDRLCNNRSSVCPKCKAGHPARKPGEHDRMACLNCGEEYRVCNGCGDGWMREPSGWKGNPFLGCSRYPECKHTIDLSVRKMSQKRR